MSKVFFFQIVNIIFRFCEVIVFLFFSDVVCQFYFYKYPSMKAGRNEMIRGLKIKFNNKYYEKLLPYLVVKYGIKNSRIKY